MTGTRRYLEFIHEQSRETPFPASEPSLCLFVAWLHTQRLSSSTVKNYLAAVCHSQIALGVGDPKMSEIVQLEYVIWGMKRQSQAQKRIRLPISLDILEGMRRIWLGYPNTRDAAMLWAAASTCFFGFLRVGEIVSPGDKFDPAYHQAQGDVRVNDTGNPQFMTVRIKESKTDPFRKGITIYLGKTHNKLCPVAALLSYMVQRGKGEGPFFKFADGRLLTRESFVRAVREALTSLGYDCTHYAGHSFRVGAATTAAQKGMQDSLIKTLGRWESAAYMVYIQTPPDILCRVAGTLAQEKLTPSVNRTT